MEECPCLPSITKLFLEEENNLTLTWTHPCDGPPASNYVVTMFLVITSGSFSMQDPSYVTLSPSTTSATFSNIDVEKNNYVFIVTAVSGNMSLSSQPKQSKLCMCTFYFALSIMLDRCMLYTVVVHVYKCQMPF